MRDYLNPPTSYEPGSGGLLGDLGGGYTSTPGSGGGGLTTVTVNAPLTGEGTSGTPLSLPAASSSTSGYLSSTHWSMFDAKEPALGNPAGNGYLLSSTSAGVRSWVAPGTPSAHASTHLVGGSDSVFPAPGAGFFSYTGGTYAWEALAWADMPGVAQDKILGRYNAGTGTVEEISCTPFARTILGDADAAAVRTTIGAQASLGFTPYNATNPSNYIALASAITGYTAGANTALAVTDTLLAALGKVQGQITARVSFPGFGTTASLACVGNDPRLSDARTPTTHNHGNITDGGYLGTTANLPLITGTGGVIIAGSFGTAAYTFCQGNDARLSDARTPLSHTLLGHTVSGLTTGHFLKALSATTFGFAAHDLTYSDVGAAASSHTHTGTYEPALGNPGTNGYVLSSTAAGVRSWVAPGGSVAWGGITGTLSSQTDLQTALNAKAPTTHTHSVSQINTTTGGPARAIYNPGDGYATEGVLPIAAGGTGTSTAPLALAALGAEPALGNPAGNGYLLSSTTAGVRSWVAPGTPSAHASTHMVGGSDSVFPSPASGFFSYTGGTYAWEALAWADMPAVAQDRILGRYNTGAGTVEEISCTPFARSILDDVDAATVRTTIGADPAWTYVKLTSDFTTSSATAVDVTGLYFTPAINSTYEVEGTFLLRTATTTVGPRPGLAWPTNCTDGVASMWVTSSATAQLITNGNISASLLCAVGGLPTTTGSFPGFIQSTFITGAGTSGNWKVQIASETAGTLVTMKAGSWIRYRKLP